MNPRLELREVEPDDWSGCSNELPRLRFGRVVAEDGYTHEVRQHLHDLRARGVAVGLLLGDVLPNPEGSTKRGVPADYDGSDPRLCNARTKSGKPCRALKLKGGRCKWHGGLSTGPRTPEGKVSCARNLPQARKP
ncbi:HGGxSTG domain-containing protein [Metallibacterium sp.]|uniref:HGGxSTG domain-containing protein n=1 Tax=Metallibacterium sp. TaxID=2940281 RepID=UPI00262C531C|nr:HGGxSTG domain-containing protein [Metallibacterium sp.]